MSAKAEEVIETRSTIRDDHMMKVDFGGSAPQFLPPQGHAKPKTHLSTNTSDIGDIH